MATKEFLPQLGRESGKAKAVIGLRSFPGSAHVFRCMLPGSCLSSYSRRAYFKLKYEETPF